MPIERPLEYAVSVSEIPPGTAALRRQLGAALARLLLKDLERRLPDPPESQGRGPFERAEEADTP